MHGWGISQRIQTLSRDALQVGQGSLYPALQRLEERGWIEPEWRHTEEGRRAKYYSLTKTGRKALGEELGAWRRYIASVELVWATRDRATAAKGARMNRLTGLLRQLRTLFRKEAVDREQHEEMAFHLQMQIEQFIREGKSPEEARRAAHLAFGGWSGIGRSGGRRAGCASWRMQPRTCAMRSARLRVVPASP